MNVPHLRFDGFDEEWETFELKKLVKLEGGATPLKSEKRYWQDGHIPWVSSQEVGPKKLDKTTFNITEAGVSETSTKMVDKDTLLLVVRSGILARKIPLSITALPMAINQDIKAMIIKDKKLHHLFLYQWMKKNEKAMLSNVVKGGTTVQSVNTPDLQDYLIGIPSINEQYKIAGFFELIDGKIEKLQEKIEKLEQLKKGMMQKIFSQELRFKDEDGGEFGEWEEKLLNEISLINPKTEPLEEKFYYIDLESVEKGRVEELKTVNLEDAPSRAQRVLMKDDVLFQTVRPYQQNHYYLEELSDLQIVASTGFAQIRTVHNSRYIYYLMHTEEFSQEVLNRCTGTSYPAINSNHLGKINVPVPPLAEQTKIADFLFNLDKKLTKEIEKLMVLEEQKKGFMQGIFV